ncbi:hypothetical protein GDO81_019980 [Engystomops pustulosus]|uniref:Secreted protein n=1 Tax=Engystomops pustulosus TaxID=76066 RepID=A0AAV6ZF60_ENGPU|nr:hypothetical protein GDO81_019980 [Engystomops pustulosus]
MMGVGVCLMRGWVCLMMGGGMRGRSPEKTGGAALQVEGGGAGQQEWGTGRGIYRLAVWAGQHYSIGRWQLGRAGWRQHGQTAHHLLGEGAGLCAVCPCCRQPEARFSTRLMAGAPLLIRYYK